MSNPEIDFVVYCADIGTELDKQQNFAWACSDVEENKKDKKTLETLAESIVYNIVKKIAIGFECPLYFDMQSNSRLVTKGRGYNEIDAKKGGGVDGNRAWCAAIGASVFATGLAQTTWLFNKLYERMNENLPEIFIMNSWEEFLDHDKPGIFIWEAFVSNKPSKKEDNKIVLSPKPKNSDEHIIDATIGVLAFLQGYMNETKDPHNKNPIDGAITPLQDTLKEYLKKLKENKEYPDRYIKGETERIEVFLLPIKGNSEQEEETQKDDNPHFSIIGSVLLRTGWFNKYTTTEIKAILNKNCIVIKP